MSDHLQNIEPAPDWLRDECMKAIKLFGFADWQVSVFVCDMLERDGRKIKGEASADSAYLQAHLYFDRSVTEESRVVIYHECLHLVFSELEHALDHHVIGALTSEYAGHYAGLYMWHFERLIERVARAMVKLEANSTARPSVLY